MNENRILIVENDLDLRLSLRDHYEFEGYIPIAVEEGKKAIELVRMDSFSIVVKKFVSKYIFFLFLLQIES